MNKILIGAAAMAMVASFGVSTVVSAGDKEAEAAGIVAVERDGHDAKGHDKHAEKNKMDKHAAKDEAMKGRKKMDDKNIPK